MKFLTLDYITQHSRIDGTCEATVLNLYGESAEATLANYVGYDSVDAMIESFGGKEKFPAPLKQAALMLVDVSYNNRAPISNQNMSVVPYTFDILVKPYVKL